MDRTSTSQLYGSEPQAAPTFGGSVAVAENHVARLASLKDHLLSLESRLTGNGPQQQANGSNGEKCGAALAAVRPHLSSLRSSLDTAESVTADISAIVDRLHEAC